MAKEFERRFLVKDALGAIKALPPVTVADCYWPLEGKHCQLRLRRVGSKFEITKKVPVNESDLSVMEEHTIPLTEAEYDALKTAPGKWLVKHRYFLQTDDCRIELGVFQERLQGLNIADVEFETEVQMRRFVPPDWFHSEVTHEKRFAGGELCGRAIDDLIEMLEAYGFQVHQ